MVKLTNENYFSPEMNMKYMGSSQIKSFLECEKKAMAELKGEYVREMSTALLVGSYVDSHFEGTLDLFKAQHPEMFKKDGGLKSDYISAEEIIIPRIESDPIMMKYLSGEKQVIKTGEINGVKVKIKIDSYFPKKAIIDQKIMKDMKPIWNEEKRCKESFVENYLYDLQGSLYQAIEGDKLPFILAVATKEKTPDIELLEIPQDRLDYIMETVILPNINRFDMIKKGEIEPVACGKCDYCISKKKLIGVKDYRNLGY